MAGLEDLTQDWMNRHPDRARPSVGCGKPVVNTSTEDVAALAPAALDQSIMAPSNQPVPTRPDADEAPVTPEVEAELRRRLETFDEDAKAARPWQDVSREP